MCILLVEKFAVLPMEVEQANAEQEEPPPSLQEVGDFKFKEVCQMTRKEKELDFIKLTFLYSLFLLFL